MSKKRSNVRRPIRVGVVGVGRGMSFARSATDTIGMQLVALCDTWEERLLEAGRQLGVSTYTDYEQFLGHDMDAVVLANYFHEHAPFAIRALAAGRVIPVAEPQERGDEQDHARTSQPSSALSADCGHARCGQRVRR